MAEQWLTYQQAGELLGVSAEAIRRHAARHRWRRQRGNDGRALVLVTEREAGQVRARPGGHQPGRPGGHLSGRPPGQAGEVATVADMMAALVADRRAAEAKVAEVRQEADQLRERAARAEGELDGLREAMRRADAGVQRAEEGRRTAEVERDAARGEAAQLRDDALAERERASAALARAVAAEQEAAKLRAEAAAQADAERQGREAAERELAARKAGGPLVRAWRALVFRRGQ